MRRDLLFATVMAATYGIPVNKNLLIVEDRHAPKYPPPPPRDFVEDLIKEQSKRNQHDLDRIEKAKLKRERKAARK